MVAYCNSILGRFAQSGYREKSRSLACIAAKVVDEVVEGTRILGTSLVLAVVSDGVAVAVPKRHCVLEQVEEVEKVDLEDGPAVEAAAPEEAAAVDIDTVPDSDTSGYAATFRRENQLPSCRFLPIAQRRALLREKRDLCNRLVWTSFCSVGIV